jgi:ketosteroid isomerase-like protein
MYTSGDLAGALDLLAQNPGVSNDSAVKDVSARIANAAFDSMNSSEKDARARNAADLAGEALRVANDAKSRAESARQRSALVDAGIQALLARDAYQQAAVQALARRQPAVIPASAATAPPHDALESERAGIVATLGRFQAAYRDRDMNALLQVFPSLQREARQALERAFRDCRAYDVGFGEMELLLNPADATAAQVTVPTTYSCTVRTGQRPQVAAQRDVFVLRKRGGTWIIERTGSVN